MREFYLPLTKTVTIRLPIRPKLEVGKFSALKELVFRRQPARNDGSFDYFFPYSEDDKVNEGYLMEETDDVNAVHAAKESLLAVTWVRDLVGQRKKELIIKDDFRCIHQDDTTTLDPTLPPWPDTSRESMNLTYAVHNSVIVKRYMLYLEDGNNIEKTWEHGKIQTWEWLFHGGSEERKLLGETAWLS